MRPDRKLLLLSLPVVLIGGLVATIIGGFVIWRVAAHYFYPLELIAKAAPTQPIRFTHVTHAGQLGIDCTFCHRTVTEERTAGIPAVQQCMFCHAVIKGVEEDKASEIAKLQEYAANDEPIDWIRVHRLPDHVQFTHEVHIRRLPEVLGLGEDFQIQAVCSTCHGKIWEMEEVRQVRALKMGNCVDCHRANNAPTDCVICHY